MKGYQINTSLPLEENIRGIQASVIEQLGLPDAFRKDPYAAIHETRKTIKRIRALLKMVRDGTGYGFYLRENRYFRDLSRGISLARDYDVLLDTLNFVASKTRKHAESRAEELKASIREARDRELETLSAPGGCFEKIPDAFDRALKRMDSFLQHSGPIVSVKRGLRRTYRKGRRLLDPVRKTSDMHHTHEFRKSCRYLQFQMELLVPLYPALLKGYAGSIDSLTTKLGNIHDLQKLNVYLFEQGYSTSVTEPDSPLIHTIQKQTRRSYSDVFALAPLVYAEKPGRFADRMQHYWNTTFYPN